MEVEIDKQTIREIDAFEKACAGREIHTESEEAEAVKMVQLIKARIAKLEADRKAVTKPINDKKRSIDKLFRPFTQRLRKLENDLKMSIFQSTQRREEANQAAMAAAQAAAQAGAPSVSTHLDAIDDRPLPPSTSMRRHWEVEIIDASKIPLGFWSPDPEKIKAWVNQHTDFANPPTVEGLRISVGGSITVRKAKE